MTLHLTNPIPVICKQDETEISNISKKVKRLILLAFLLVFSFFYFQLPTYAQEPEKPSVSKGSIFRKPDAPSSLQVEASNDIMLTWIDEADNEEGFTIFYNGTVIASVEANVTAYTIPDLNRSPSCFMVIAFNMFGSSSSDGYVCDVEDYRHKVTDPVDEAIDMPSQSNHLLQGQMAFISDRDGNYEIYTINVDGSDITRLTNTSKDEFEPAWSPNGDKILFSSLRTGGPSIYTMNTDGTNVIQLTSDTYFDAWGSWSPDGQKIVFGSYQHDDSGEIYIMNSDGSNQTRLTFHPEGDCCPRWSPDGEQIAFETNRDGNTEIYVMDIDGSNQRNLTSNLSGDFFPSWSPDGRYITFESNRDGNSEIYIMDNNGSNQVNLTNHPAPDYPITVWSPDGQHIAFTRDLNGQGEIYIMDADGSNQVRFTENSANDASSSWKDINDGSYSISGRVTDGNLAPIAGVTISIPSGKYDTTDTTGTYRISDLASGLYEIIASKDGYDFLPESRKVTVLPDTPHATEQDFTLPFLDLPINYTNFAVAAQGKYGNNPGRVTSWFDHFSPDYSKNEILQRWDGAIFVGSKIDVNECGPGLGVYCYDGHNGIDFSHDKKLTKENIYAAAPGLVLDVVRSSKGYGNRVWIKHNGDYATLYSHFDEIFVEKGTTITDRLSQPLGTMGDTGNSEGIHLHFGLYYDHNDNNEWEDGFYGSYTEVVDPYGWNPMIGIGTDEHAISSHYLWKYPLKDQALVDSSGSSLKNPANNVTVTVPPAALSTPVNMELWIAPPVAEVSAQLRSIGQSFWVRVLEWLPSNNPVNLSVSSQGFDQPLTLSVTYESDQMKHFNISQLSIHQWIESSNTWISLPTTVDTNQKLVTANADEPGHFDLQAALLCSADIYEINDDYDQARLILAKDPPITLIFDIPDDEDWFRLETTAGDTYTIQTTNLGVGVDTIIELYDTDGVTVLATDDNGSGNVASKLDWLAPQDDIYFIRVAQSSGSSNGCNSNYDLSVIQNGENLYLPLILR